MEIVVECACTPEAHAEIKHNCKNPNIDIKILYRYAESTQDSVRAIVAEHCVKSSVFPRMFREKNPEIRALIAANPYITKALLTRFRDTERDPKIRDIAGANLSRRAKAKAK